MRGSMSRVAVAGVVVLGAAIAFVWAIMPVEPGNGTVPPPVAEGWAEGPSAPDSAVEAWGGSGEMGRDTGTNLRYGGAGGGG